MPSGQLLFSDFSTDLEVFTPKGTYKAAWQPRSHRCRPRFTHGKTYVVKGTQFSGLTNGAAYGDDFQDSTNYALVRITNNCDQARFLCQDDQPEQLRGSDWQHGRVD